MQREEKIPLKSSNKDLKSSRIQKFVKHAAIFDQVHLFYTCPARAFLGL